MGEVVSLFKGHATAVAQVSEKPTLVAPNSKPNRPPIVVDRAALYHCARCNTKEFQVTFEGWIVCADCEAVIYNIEARSRT